VVDLGFAYQRNKAGTSPDVFTHPNTIYSQFGITSGQEAASRRGLKGVEDLGRGLKAVLCLKAASMQPMDPQRVLLVSQPSAWFKTA